MKKHLKKINSGIASIALAPVVLLATCPAFSALPTIQPPAGGSIGGGTTQEGDVLGQMGAYFKLGMTILGLVLAAIAFLFVVTASLQRYRDYTAGKIQLGDLKEFVIVSVIIISFVILMVNYAAQALS
ncbi:TIGR03745 family integrating conjugative element membrane protein [Comamonas testosteroni]|uniref:TIGR03745 family integrating conjugative element membrane protein n=1 Tax=Comamonas TaxID=283 RepID=UPI00265EB7FD|nr:TIGR03745 family integrating conjugative element membrane protein [Comamonas testosteroni]WKL15850.1 TIGR03745 family integrating conjugative element membrane protein [Comamonas testosteroni]